jgi:hypothetical protein
VYKEHVVSTGEFKIRNVKEIVVFGIFNCQISVYSVPQYIEGGLNFSLSRMNDLFITKIAKSTCGCSNHQSSYITFLKIKTLVVYGVSHIMLVMHTPNPLMDLKLGMRTDNG